MRHFLAICALLFGIAAIAFAITLVVTSDGDWIARLPTDRGSRPLGAVVAALIVVGLLFVGTGIGGFVGLRRRNEAPNEDTNDEELRRRNEATNGGASDKGPTNSGGPLRR